MPGYTSYYASPAGWLQINCSEEHITSVLFVDAPSDANDRNGLLHNCKRQLDEYFKGARKVFDLPTNQTGTVFQKNVWELLSRIPFGKTISYHDLSRQYGNVKAIRAVAAANGKNSLAIIVPCHRVIGSNRHLTGYAGGLWRKQWLLVHEAKYHAGVQLLNEGW